MNAKLVTFGPWRIPVAVKGCLCPDGKRRRVRLTSGADTFFSIPASVQVYVPGAGTNVWGEPCVGRVTVSGFVTGREDENGGQDYEFVPVQGRKNSDAFAKLAEGRA